MMTRSMYLLLAALVAVAALSGCTAYVYDPDAPGPKAVRPLDTTDFYVALSPYGEWIVVDGYGWVWIPDGVPVGWRPYTHGRWVYTHHGWTWVSDWSWGWAPFHYGRWTFHSSFGWIWRPGRTWGPGWVAWRSGPGWIGWAPLPPGVTWRVGVGLDFGAVDLNLSLGAATWSFVEDHHFYGPRLHSRLVLPVRNRYLLGDTRIVTRYVEVDRRIVNRSIEAERIRKLLGRDLPRYRVEDVDRPPARKDRLNGERVRVYRPDLPASGADGPPATLPKKAAPSPRQRDEELRRVDRWREDRERELTRIQKTETKRPPDGLSAEDLARRQAEERQVLREQAEKQREIVKNRQKRLETDSKASSAKKGKASGKKPQKKGGRGRKLIGP